MNTSGHRFPKAIILFAVYSKLKFGLSYREVEELLQMRGVSIDHSTIQRWVFKKFETAKRTIGGIEVVQMIRKN